LKPEININKSRRAIALVEEEIIQPIEETKNVIEVIEETNVEQPRTKSEQEREAEEYLQNLAQARAEGKLEAEKVAIAVCDKCPIRKETLDEFKEDLDIMSRNLDILLTTIQVNGIEQVDSIQNGLYTITDPVKYYIILDHFIKHFSFKY
jgi:hypothetical protein